MTNTVRLGKTGIITGKNAFGALPIQRVSKDDAVRILRKAYEGGVTFYDSARGYSDSEEKLGAAFAGMRERVFIATKTHASTPEALIRDLETSLRTIGTDYIDVYQFHNPAQCFLPGDGSGMYEAMLTAKAEGKIRHIGLSSHRCPVATKAVESGYYETLQYPFSYLCSDMDLALVELCREREVGFIAMKALSGGILNNSRAAYAYLDQFDHVLPIWGIQRESELDEFLSYIKNPPELDAELSAIVDADRASLCGEFCRACGYCMPCPVGIEINTSARIIPLLGRAPYKRFLTKDWQERMRRIEDCLHCNQCMSHCPYDLNTPELLSTSYEFYKEFLAQHAGEAE